METATGMVVLSDPEVAGIPVIECGEPLVDLRAVGALRLDSRLADPQGAFAMLRLGVVDRLVTAQTLLPVGLRLLIIEGYRPLALQRQYFEAHVERLRANDPWADEAELRRRASAYVAPPEVAPHVAGAAVDLTLCTVDGAELPMGTEVNDTDTNCVATSDASTRDVTPGGAMPGGAETSHARGDHARGDHAGTGVGITRACHTASTGIDAQARENRRLLSAALSAAGLINYPSEWWHWSYGDRYWAFATKAGSACYGPVQPD